MAIRIAKSTTLNMYSDFLRLCVFIECSLQRTQSSVSYNFCLKGNECIDLSTFSTYVINITVFFFFSRT